MGNALYIMLGWILGLFSPVIVEKIQRHYRRRELRHSLFIELNELRGKLALIVISLALNNGSLDRSLLNWIRPVLSSYKGDASDKSILDVIKGFLELDDEQIACFKGTVRNYSLNKHTLPFLTFQIPSLFLFSSEFQRLALDINARLATLNSEIDVAWFHYTKTIDSTILEENQSVICKNLEATYRSIASASRGIVDRITLLLSLED